MVAVETTFAQMTRRSLQQHSKTPRMNTLYQECAENCSGLNNISCLKVSTCITEALANVITVITKTHKETFHVIIIVIIVNSI